MKNGVQFQKGSNVRGPSTETKDYNRYAEVMKCVVLLTSVKFL